MTLKHRILEQLKTAMRSKDEITLSTLRLLHAKIKEEEIAKRKREEGLSDEEITAVIARQIKQRRDSIEQFKKGGRADLAEREQKELEILQSFMPAPMSEEEIRAVAGEVIAGGATDFGAVMGAVMQKVKGRAEGGVVKRVVEEIVA